MRRSLEALPVRRIDPERLGAMRFELLAAARKRPASTPSERPAPQSSVAPPRRARAWRIPALLAAAIGLVALALVLAFPRAQHPTAVADVAEIELADGATGVRAHDGPDQVFALLRGSAHFHVRHLEAGERFRVVAGGDTVEVRGTRFRVDVDEGKMSAVEVQEGAVLLTLAEGETHALVAGESWHRESLVVGGPVGGLAPEAASAVPSETSSPRAPEAPHAGPAHASAPLASAKGSAEPASSSRPDDLATFDADFGRALELLHKGRASEAAASFDALRGNAAVDPGRRADALYWAARAHKEAGHGAEAEERARLAAETPGSWHAEDAALMLGEALLRRGDVAGAKPLLERAARSERESVRARARRALDGAASTPK